MSSSSPPPVPLLKPPVPGRNKNNSSPSSTSSSPRQPPKLKLGIPPSPNVKPVHDNGVPLVADIPQMPHRPGTGARPAAPPLRLSTPMNNGKEVHQEGRPVPPPLITTTSNESNGLLDGKASGPTSATSSTYSALSFAKSLRQPQGTPDPSSAISSVYSDSNGNVAMERENSVNGLLPDLDKLSLEKGRPLDVDDLDDEGWLAASERKKIVELGSLGEGAGGAVTRCKLKNGKTVFALKVG